MENRTACRVSQQIGRNKTKSKKNQTHALATSSYSAESTFFGISEVFLFISLNKKIDSIIQKLILNF